jgi:hypothetical protein
MPPNKRSVSGSVSAPNTPQRRIQKSSNPSVRLRAGTPSLKRKASTPLADYPVSSQKKVKTSNAPRGRPKKEAVVRNNQGQVVSEQDYEAQPYTIQCPAKPAQKNETIQNVFRSKDCADIGLEVDYAVRPGNWDKMKSYKTAKCKSSYLLQLIEQFCLGHADEVSLKTAELNLKLVTSHISQRA